METGCRFAGVIANRQFTEWAVNGVLPVAWWDFSNANYYPSFRLARASSGLGYDASGRFTTYAADQLRLDQRGSRRVALLERAATNLLPNSQARIGTGWALSGATGENLSLNALGAFAGVNVVSGGALWHRLLCEARPSLTSGMAYCLTFWFKFGSSGQARIAVRNNADTPESVVNLTATTATLGAQNAGTLTASELAALGVDDVYRARLSLVPNFTGEVNFGIGPNSATSGGSIVILGAQLETGANATTYIPTTGSAATRAADAPAWNAPNGIWDLRTVAANGAATDTRNVTVAAGWTPRELPFSPAWVLLFPTGTL